MLSSLVVSQRAGARVDPCGAASCETSSREDTDPTLAGLRTAAIAAPCRHAAPERAARGL